LKINIKALVSVGMLSTTALSLAQIGGRTAVKQEFPVGSKITVEKNGVRTTETISPNMTLKVNGVDFKPSVDHPLVLSPDDDAIFPDGSVARIPPSFTLTLDPLAVFSYAGALPQGGGTESFTGVILAPNYAIGLSRQRSLEFGGFYFFEQRGRDIYQIDSKYYFNRSVGIQASYLNLKTGNAPAFTGFLLLRIDAPNQAPRNWEVVFGTGAYLNVGNEVSHELGSGGNLFFPSVPASTLNFSFFVNGSLNLGKNISLTAGNWYIRDRNSELNRFTLGLGFKF